MLVIACIGLVVNLVSLQILGGHSHGNLNVRAAFLHVVGDALGSAGVILAAIVIRFTGWTPIDALVSIFIAGLILLSGWRLVRETVSVLLESAPRNLDSDALPEGSHRHRRDRRCPRLARMDGHLRLRVVELPRGSDFE